MSPAAKKPPPKDIATRLIGLMGAAIELAEQEMADLLKGTKPDPKRTLKAARLATQMAPFLGHIRRFEEGQTKELTDPIVITYLRKLPADRRAEVIAESEAAEAESAGVLG